MDPSMTGIDDQQQQEAQKHAQMAERRAAMLQQLLTPEAQQRLNTIAIVKPEKAAQVGDLLLAQAQRTQGMTERVNEQRLKQLLAQVEQSTRQATEPKIVFQRKKYQDSSDEEEYDL